ncbi:MAG: histidine kinase N-terminal 7TM domain-containing protein [Patescibacteria group bacterium]|jgi:hypothetical protein
MPNQLLAASVLVFTVLSFSLGIFSLYRNPKALTVRLWFLMSMAVGFWSLGLLALLWAQTEETGVLYSKLLHVGASFIPIFFLHFVLSFLYKLNDKNKKKLLIVGYVLAVVFAILSLTKEIIAGAPPIAGLPVWVSAGRLYPFLLLYFWFYVMAGVYFLCQGYRQTDGVMRRKIFFILLASAFGFGGGGTNFLPQTLGIYPFGNFFAWLYPILITYGIFVDEFKIRIKF